MTQQAIQWPADLYHSPWHDPANDPVNLLNQINALIAGEDLEYYPENTGYWCLSSQNTSDNEPTLLINRVIPNPACEECEECGGEGCDFVDDWIEFPLSALIIAILSRKIDPEPGYDELRQLAEENALDSGISK